MFEYLVPNWWHCLCRFNGSDLAGRSVSLKVDFESLKIHTISIWLFFVPAYTSRCEHFKMWTLTSGSCCHTFSLSYALNSLEPSAQIDPSLSRLCWSRYFYYNSGDTIDAICVHTLFSLFLYLFLPLPHKDILFLQEVKHNII